MTQLRDVADASEGVVALLLDDLAPPRLGTLLKGARKRGALTRREVAGRVGTTTAELRRYERGDTPVPAHVIAALAECYGADLTAQFATRSPLIIDANRIVAGSDVAVLDNDSDDDVLEKYAHLLGRVRHSQPGDPIALRARDLVALSRALGHDADHIEARIVELLGCTDREARSLHAEMLRRKLVVPVAGLVTGLAVVTGIGVAAAATGPSHAPPAHHATAPPAPTTTPQTAAPPSTVAAPSAATDVTSTPAPARPTTETHAPTQSAGPADVAPPTEPPTTTDGAPTTTETPHPTAAAPAALPRPVITTDTTPMSIPANETVTIIQP